MAFHVMILSRFKMLLGGFNMKSISDTTNTDRSMLLVIILFYSHALFAHVSFFVHLR